MILDGLLIFGRFDGFGPHCGRPRPAAEISNERKLRLIDASAASSAAAP
jgi:hypothetical protein